MTGRLVAVVLLLVGAACAQIQLGPNDVVRRLRVQLAFNDNGCDFSTRVVLSGDMGAERAEGSVDGECRAEFFDVPSGRYRVLVRGNDATNADGGDVQVSSFGTQDVEVRAKHTKSDPANRATHSSFISVDELRVPSNAAKEFVKANRSIAKQDWAKASDSLRKGLAVYPNYAAAYNNLGAVYSRMGKSSEARQALQQAIALDEHLAAAYVNLGRISFLDKDYPNAESLLTMAVALEPAANADELFLLAYSQLTDHHLDQALQTSRQGHEAGLSQHGFLHLVAANAFEQENKIPDCMTELQAYLREEPAGPQAEKTKKALSLLQSRSTSAISAGSH
jgi:Flp pilus assembly protein TadD